jgi:trans-2,3-dihydro-3-hydroxyanthranilate isomerase
MAHYSLLQVDAFTTQPLSGNPCAIVFDADDLDDRSMLAIAREMNLSETAFVVRSAIADFGVRYFTPAEEIPLAGHPTIATTCALIDTGRLKLNSEFTIITLEMKVGPIIVEIHSRDGVADRIVMSQKKPRFLALHRAEDVLPLFDLKPSDALPDAPIQTVSTGTPQIMIPVRDHAALRRAQIDANAYIAYRNKSDFFSPHLFCLQGTTDRGRTFARHFGVPPDTMEDPFTGSATGGMAAYLWHYGLIDQPTFIAEQGHWLNRPGEATVEIIGPRDNIETVKVGGSAITVFRGELVI